MWALYIFLNSDADEKEGYTKKREERMGKVASSSTKGNGNKKVQYLIAYVVSLASVAMGAYSAWPAPVMPKFQNNETDVRITPDEMAWMVALSSPGFMAGGFFSRFFADWLGRRINILASALPVAVATIVAITTVQAWCLYIARFLWGVGCGMYATVVTLYLAEIADKEIRGAITLVTRFMFNLGNLLVMCVGPFVSYKTFNLLLLAFPLIYFIACFWIPESPYYCLKEGKVEAAKKVLSRIRKYEDGKSVEDDLQQMKSDVRNEMRHSSTFKEMITGKKYRKALVIAFGLKATQMFSGQLVLAEYLGLIMLESGTDIELTYIFIVYGALRFIASITSSMLADRVGRRPLLIYSYLGTAVCLGVVGVYFLFSEVFLYDMEYMKPYSFIPFAGIILCNVISTLGFYSLIVVVPAEIFPLNIKAIAMTCFSIFGGLLNFCVARGYQSLKNVAGLCGIFWFLAIAGIVGCLFSALYVPETKGKSLREIQELLQGDLYESDEVYVKLNSLKLCRQDAIEEKELLEVHNGNLKNAS